MEIGAETRLESTKRDTLLTYSAFYNIRQITMLLLYLGFRAFTSLYLLVIL